jgi:PAS domain S-box-containing protein
MSSDPPADDEDLSWITDNIRQCATEMLDVLFASSRICLIVFDAKGIIQGVNPYAESFGGQPQAQYRGVSLVDHLVLRRLGWSQQIKRVLDGETVELTDTRWVTLFSGEERYVDMIAGPVMVQRSVIGGVAYLVDSTSKQRAAAAELAHRRRLRELEVFLAHDVAALVASLQAWSGRASPSDADTAVVKASITDLSSLLDDLLQFVQIGTYKPRPQRTLLLDVLRAAGLGKELRNGDAGGLGSMAVFADARLLRRVLRNVIRFCMNAGRVEWKAEAKDGKTRLCFDVDIPEPMVGPLLTATSLSMAQAEDAQSSLAAARWMMEMMGGSLTVRRERPRLLLELPTADAARSDSAPSLL